MMSLISMYTSPGHPHPHGTPMKLQGAQDGGGLDLDIHPNNNGTTDVVGHLRGYGLDLHVSPGLDQAAHVEGHQSGFGFDLDIRRASDGGVELTGHEGGAPMHLRLVDDGGRLEANGALRGFPSRFVIENDNGTLTFSGADGGRGFAYAIEPEADGSLHLAGTHGGRPLEATVRNTDDLPITADSLGDFLLGFSPLERAAIFHVLTA